MQKLINNSGKKKATTQEKEGINYPHSASFRQGLKNKSREEVVELMIALWIKYENQCKAYRRIEEYTTTAINIIVQNQIPFPTMKEYKDLIK